MRNHHAIHVEGLTKSFGDHHVLRGVDLSVPAGSVLALLGSNGAGKTTTVHILSTLPAEEVAAAIVTLAEPGAEWASGAVVDFNGASHLR